MHRLSALIGSGFIVAGVLNCGGSDLFLPSESRPGEIALVDGNNQSGPAGGALARPLIVKVLDRRGQALSKQQVAFSPGTEASDASLSPATAETRFDGTAQAEWILGRTSGTQTAVARVVGVDGLQFTFTALVGAAEAAEIRVAGGDGQSAPVGSRLDPLSVRVTDGFGNPVQGATVEWNTDDGSVNPESSVTGEDGLAEASWTLGASTGTQSASASSRGLEGSPVDFSATARPGSAKSLERVAGNNQSARAGTEVPDPLIVRLLDEAGNGIPNRAVSWLVATGGGRAADDNTTTDDAGRTSTRWTLGADPGGNTLNAVVSGVGAVSFSATGTGSGGGGGGGGGSNASRLAFSVQPSDVEEKKRISPAVEVEVLDQAGNRVTGGEFEIKLELSGNRRGKLQGDRSQRTESGVATFHDLRVERDGHYRLRASTDGLPSVESDEFEVEED